MANLRRSMLINLFSSTGSTLMKFIVSVMLARILSPSEIGVFSMTLVFVNIAHIFRDFGVGSYLQRERDLTPDKIRSAMGVAFTTSWLIAALIYFVSDYIAAWFKEPGMVPVLHVLALGFLFIPFGAITSALLTREFRADKQIWVNMAGTISYCASCLVLALLDFGSMALAWGNLINIIVCALVYIPLRPAGMPWRPGFRHWRGVMHFGVGSLVSNCAVAVESAIPDVLLGKLGSAHMVGLFSRANSTVTIFTHIAGSTVSYGAVSYLAKSHHAGESLRPTLMRATAMLTGVGWTALALTAVLGTDIVLALYGTQWLESVSAILPLTIAAAVIMLFHYTPMALTAIGRPYLGAVPVIVTIVSRIAFGYMLFDNTLATFGWAICLATLAAAPVMAFQQHRYFGLDIGSNLRALLPSTAVAASCAAAAALLNWAIPHSLPAFSRLMVMALPLAGIWYLGLRLTGHPLLNELHQVGRGLRERLGSLLGAAPRMPKK